MFVESVKFKRTKESNWERGYYIGDTYNREHSLFLDLNYIPLQKDEDGHPCWDYHTDTENWIQFRCND